MKELLKQAVRFIGLSGIGWILDFTVYTILSQVSGNLFLNNYISSWVGVTFVFLFSTRLIFKKRTRVPLWAKYLIYLAYQAILIFIISKLLDSTDAFITAHFSWQLIVKYSYILAKIIVTPITMILNFFVMKGVVEKI